MTGGPWLGYEVTRRRLSLWRASGGALAARLGGRRMPASVAAATRLAPRRVAARAPAEDDSARLQVPGMNDAAARWLFLGELPEGMQPLLGGQPTGGAPSLPSASARRASRAAQAGGVRRGRVEEGPAVARTPAVADVSPSPADEPSRPRALDAPRTAPSGDQPSTTPAPVRARRLARAPASEPAEPASSTPPAVPQRPTPISAEPPPRTPSEAKGTRPKGDSVSAATGERPSTEIVQRSERSTVARASSGGETAGRVRPAADETAAGDDVRPDVDRAPDAPDRTDHADRPDPIGAPAQRVMARRSETTETPPEAPAGSPETPLPSSPSTAAPAASDAAPRSTRRPKNRTRPEGGTEAVQRSDRPTVARASTRDKTTSRPRPTADAARGDVDRVPRAAADQAAIGERPSLSESPPERVVARSLTTGETPSADPDAASRPSPGLRTGEGDRAPSPPAETPGAVVSRSSRAPKTRTRPDDAGGSASDGEQSPTDTVRRSDRPTVARASTRGETTKRPRAAADAPVAAGEPRHDVARAPRPTADQAVLGERPGPSAAPAQRVTPRRPTTSETQSLARTSSSDDSASEPPAETDAAETRDEARPELARAATGRRTRAAADRTTINERPGPSDIQQQRVVARASTPSETTADARASSADDSASESRARAGRPVARDEARSDAPAHRVTADASKTGETRSIGRSSTRDETTSQPRDAVVAADDSQSDVEPSDTRSEGVVARASTTGGAPSEAPADPKPATPSRAVAREPHLQRADREGAPARPEETRTSDDPGTAPDLPESTPPGAARMRLRPAPSVRDEPVATPSGSDTRPGNQAPASDRSWPEGAAVAAPEGAKPRRRGGPAIARTPAVGEVAQSAAAGERRDAAPPALRAEHSGEAPAIARTSAPVEPASESTRLGRRASAIARTGFPGEPARSEPRAPADSPQLAELTRDPAGPAGEWPSSPVEPAREPTGSARPAPAVARAPAAEPSRPPRRAPAGDGTPSPAVDRPVAVPRGGSASPPPVSVATLARAPASRSRRSPAQLRPVSRTRAAEPEPARSSPPAVNGRAALARRIGTRPSATTDPTRLAALSGGALVAAPDGRASVVFSSAGGQPASSVRAATTATAHGPLPVPTPTPASAPAPSIDVDDLYDQIAARLRRELLLDRERAGELP